MNGPFPLHRLFACAFICMGLIIPQVQAGSLDPLMTLVKKYEGPQSKVTYFNHVQKGDVVMLQTFEKGPGGPGSGDMHHLYVIDTKTQKLYGIRSNDQTEPVYALGSESFVSMIIDSPTQVRFTQKIDHSCFDYKAVWNARLKLYQPNQPKERHC